MASGLYYERTKSSAFATLQNLRDAVGQSTSKQTKNMARVDIKKWLEKTRRVHATQTFAKTISQKPLQCY